MKISEILKENLGTPYPGTYEQDHAMIKSHGAKRITAMTNEAPTQTITLSDLYKNNFPDDDELIWQYIGARDLVVPFEIKTLRPQSLKQMLELQYGIDELDSVDDVKLAPGNEALMKKYMKDPNLSNQIIVVAQDKILDGNHRALAAALTDRPIKCVDVSED